jgi:predicted TIM-barrel fold metal-dependent hydrolase
MNMIRPNNDLSRREFGRVSIRSAAALGSAVAWSTAAKPATAAEDTTAPGWIDAHVHVWTPDTAAFPLDKEFDESSMKPKSFTAEQLLAHCRGVGVQRIVLIQMSFYGLDHRYMFQEMDQHPGVFSAVALIDHQSDEVAKRMEALAERNVRGFRLHSRGDAKDWVDSPTMAKLWRKAAAADLAVCPLINPQDIVHVDALCKKHPDTTVVVDHFARLGISGQIDAQQLKQLCDLARFPNVYVKTSAFYALGKKMPPYDDLIPMIRRVLDAFGPQRLMWASDCPFQVQGVHTYEASIALIRDRIDFLSADDKQWMLKGTAEKVFFA